MPTRTTKSPPFDEDPFFSAYDRDVPAYGMVPSVELAAVLNQYQPTGNALDLGAGAGRDTLALAAAGMQVTAIDQSQRGLDRILERADAAGIADRIQPITTDVREFSPSKETFQVVVATTLLDHIPHSDALEVWSKMLQALTPSGILYVEVHTTDDPGSSLGFGATNDAPKSETADQIVHYFDPGELVRWAVPERSLRILRYEERLEWDYTHGPEHQHGKAALLAVKCDGQPKWYGHPQLFPKKDSP